MTTNYHQNFVSRLHRLQTHLATLKQLAEFKLPLPQDYYAVPVEQSIANALEEKVFDVGKLQSHVHSVIAEGLWRTRRILLQKDSATVPFNGSVYDPDGDMAFAQEGAREFLRQAVGGRTRISEVAAALAGPIEKLSNSFQTLIAGIQQAAELH